MFGVQLTVEQTVAEGVRGSSLFHREVHDVLQVICYCPALE